MWTVLYDERCEEWLNSIPPDIRAKVLRIVDILVAYEPHNVREPYVKPVKGHRKLFELRAKGQDGIARLFYFTFTGRRIVLLHGFIKKTSKTPHREIEIATKRMKEVLSWLK